MKRYSRVGSIAALLGAVLTTTALAGSATRADAATCAASSVNINQGETITLYQSGNSFVGTGNVLVYCAGDASMSGIPNSQVSISINMPSPGISASDFKIEGVGVPTTDVNASTPGNPVVIG